MPKGAAKGANEDAAASSCPSCNKKDNEEMVQCDACDAWYHFICVHVDESSANKGWKCEGCVDKPPESAEEDENTDQEANETMQPSTEAPAEKNNTLTTWPLILQQVAWEFRGLSGCAGVLVGHPLDTIKVHLQTQDSKRPIYRGTWHCLQTIVARDSIHGLYRGISSPLGGVAFVNAIVFGVYGNVQRNTTDPNSIQSHLVAGSMAGLVQSLVCSPMELAKTRLQLQNNFKSSVKYRGPIACLLDIFGKDGFRGIFRGLNVTIFRDVPGFAGYFVSYELLMRQVAAPSAFHCLIAGGLAGTISWMLTFPIDVVKSCLQADGMMTRPKYNGIVDCIQKGYQSEGIRFFCRGLTSTLLRAFPMNAACFFVVSLVMRISEGSKQLPIELHQSEPLALISAVNATSLPVQQLQSQTCQQSDSRKSRKNSKIVDSLVFSAALSEAIFETELRELAHELCHEEEKIYFLPEIHQLEDYEET